MVSERKRPPLVVVDLFCGGGGTSTGVAAALEKRRLQLDLTAINH